MMDEVLRRIQTISQKAVVFEKMVRQLRAEREELKARLVRVEQELAEKQKALEEVEKKHEQDALALNGKSREEMLSKIDSYLEEIDFCLKIFGDQS